VFPLNRPARRPVYSGMKYAATAVLLGAVSTGCTITVESHGEIVREERRFSVSGRPDVRVTTFDGSVQVQSWDRPEVLIEIEKRGADRGAIERLEIHSTQNGNSIELEVKRPARERLRMHRGAYARLIVSLPRGADVRARTGDGPIRLDGVEGRVELRTGDGSVRVNDVSGELTVHTGDGAVTLTDVSGAVSVHTGDGSVSVAGRLEVVRLHTGDGSITCRAAPGSIMAANWEITTGDGAVSLYLPEEFGAELDAHTGDGRIVNELQVEQAGGADRPRRVLRGRLGAGGRLLHVRTGDGAIRLRAN